MKQSQGLSPLFLLATVAGVALAAYFVWSSGQAPETEVTGGPSVVAPVIPPLFPRIAPAGFKEYQSATYHVSFFYPDTFLVTERKEKGTALTVMLENQTDKKQRLQLFIVPYGEKVVTPERFRTDVPSGVMLDEQSFTVDGILGTIFHSTDAKLGATVEAWFIYHGFLYEWTTYREQRALLDTVLQSWRFFPERPKEE